jgi:hypothetical protein
VSVAYGYPQEIFEPCVLVVSGAPSVRHQRAVGRLLMLLATACPTEYDVTGEEEYRASLPFPVTVRPADLVRSA